MTHPAHDAPPTGALRNSRRAGMVAVAASIATVLAARGAGAQPVGEGVDTVARPAGGAWYQRLSLRGYTQVRYNRLFETNPELRCQQCDRSLGRPGGLSLRRVRLIVSGDVNDRVFVYVQPDFASDVGGQLSVGQLRDAYFDLALDAGRTFRVRLGQSKIPFGWENMQSSSNRVPLDRADATNSAMPNERDLAALLYWAPARARRRLRDLVAGGLKGSGDYGVVGLGVFNGQGTNRAEANDDLHAVVRASYPFALRGGQVVELGVQGYAGRYVVEGRSAGVPAPGDLPDRRAAATFVLYPQPFGLQAEWNVGRGPEADPAARAVRARSLGGGYVLATYRARVGGQVLTPFARAHRYDGGKKFETDARRYRVREVEVGAEWLPNAAFELTAVYAASDRRAEDAAAPDNRQRGRVLRLQAQFNY